MPLARLSTAARKRSTVSESGSRPRPSHTSPGVTASPATAAHSVVASRRGCATPERSSRSNASSSAAASEDARSGTEPFLLTRQAQRANQVVEAAVQHLGKIVNGVMDAVIGDPVLGKVVGADLLRPVAGAHLGAPLPRPRGLLLGDHAVQEPSPQDLQSFDLV